TVKFFPPNPFDNYDSTISVVIGKGSLVADPLYALSVNGDTCMSGGGGGWETTSDERLKEDITPFTAGLREIMELQPGRFRYRNLKRGPKDNEEQIGLTAQQVQKYIPEAVTADSKGWLMLKTDPVRWAMLNAINKQQAEIETLKEKLKALRTRRGILNSPN